MEPLSIKPDYIYPGQVFDELGSLATIMPNTPGLAFNLWTLPGSRTAMNAAASEVIQSGIDPYGE
jgi:hypothetical protein